MSALQSVPGTWRVGEINLPGVGKVGGINLPDVGLTELLTGGSGSAALNNPAVYAAAGTTQQNYANTVANNAAYQSYLNGTGYNPYGPTTTSTGTTSTSKTGTTSTSNSSGSSGNTSSGPLLWNTYSTRQQIAQGHNVGDVVDGYRFTGVIWEPVGGSGSGVSQVDVDAAYNNAMSAWQDWYNSVNSGKQSFLDAYTSPYDALYSGAQEALTTGQNQVANQQSQVNTQTQSAIDAAKNLYNEVSQGAKQRFGGTSSAGDFANAYYNKALMQQVGQAYNIQGQNTQSLNTRLQDLQDQYTSAKETIDKQKAAALSNAQNLFQQRLDAINQSKVGLESDKAQAKISELQNYRSTIASMEQYYSGLNSTLYSNVLNAASQLAQTNATLKAYAGTNVDLASQITPYMNAINGGTVSNNYGNNYSGYYDPTKYYSTKYYSTM